MPFRVNASVYAQQIVQELSDGLDFQSVNKDESPVLLLLHLSLSWCHIRLWHLFRLHLRSDNTLPQPRFRKFFQRGWCWTACLASHRRCNGCNHRRVYHSFSSIEITVHFEVQHSALPRSSHSSSHFGVHVQTTIAHHHMRTSQHELSLVQTCAELIFNFDALLIVFEPLVLLQLALRPHMRDDVQLPHLAILLQFVDKLLQILNMVPCVQIRLPQRSFTLSTTVLHEDFLVGVVSGYSSCRNVNGSYKLSMHPEILLS